MDNNIEHNGLEQLCLFPGFEKEERKKEAEPEQLDLFRAVDVYFKGIPYPTIKCMNKAEGKITHRRNFRISVPYLLDLDQYNNYLKRPKQTLEEVANDNILLRKMFGGTKNSWYAPPEVFLGFNAIELCLIEAGIYQRKYVDFEEIYTTPKDMFDEPRRINRYSLSKYLDKSRIAVEGHLDKSLFEIIDHLLSATGILQIYKKYKRQWNSIYKKKFSELTDEEKRFKKWNLYDPDTIKQRADYIEKMYPQAVQKFKEVLKEPFIPPRLCIGKDRFRRLIYKNPEGYITPEKLWNKIQRKYVQNLRGHAKEVFNYFQAKDWEFLSKRGDFSNQQITANH